MSTAMHFRDHSMHKTLFPGVREGLLIIFLIEAILPMEWLRVVYALFGNLASLKIIALLFQAFYLRFFQLIHMTHWKKFKLPRSDRGFLP